MAPPSIYKSPAGEKAIVAKYDELLSRWPVPYATQTISTRYGDTFVIANGNETAPAMLLLHGAGSNSAMWFADVEVYSRHYRVYAVGLIGEPGKSAATRPSWKGEAYTEWLSEVLGGLKLEKVILVGLSQGGWTALKLATSLPERVDKLVLLTPGGITPDKLGFALRAIGLSFLGKRGTESIKRLVFGRQVIPKDVDEFMTLTMTHFKTRIGALPIFSDEELKRLTMPTLLLVGANDVLRDAKKISARLQNLLPQLTTAIIPEMGHALYDTTGHVTEFLTSQP
jgi:pimeloyl-ACP methyl ester carboxylesterase